MPQSNSHNGKTRIQQANETKILEAALEIFAQHGFRGATIDQIAAHAGMSKPNLLYYFANKEAMHRTLIDRLLETWLNPLRALDANGDPKTEIQQYIRRKLQMARDYPRESRLFANEILQGAPRIADELRDLKSLVDEKAEVIRAWSAAGQLADVDPHHLIFAIWATTQHYADFATQVGAILGDLSPENDWMADADKFLDQLFSNGLIPGTSAKSQP